MSLRAVTLSRAPRKMPPAYIHRKASAAVRAEERRSVCRVQCLPVQVFQALVLRFAPCIDGALIPSRPCRTAVSRAPRGLTQSHLPAYLVPMRLCSVV